MRVFVYENVTETDNKMLRRANLFGNILGRGALCLQVRASTSSNTALEREMSNLLNSSELSATAQQGHISRKVRRLVHGTAATTSRFRHAVTYLMVLLQGKLIRREVSAEFVSQVIEDVMFECLQAREAQLANLLFCAALRFRKNGVRLTVTTLRHLFQTFGYSDTVHATKMMFQLADQLKDEPESQVLRITALIYANRSDLVDAAIEHLKLETLVTDDICDIIKSFAFQGDCKRIKTFLASVVKFAASPENAAINLHAAACAAFSGRILTSESYTSQLIMLFKSPEFNIQFSDAAIAAIAESRLSIRRPDFNGALKLQENLREELGVKQWGLQATAVFLSHASDSDHLAVQQGHDAIARNIKRLHSLIDEQLEADIFEGLSTDKFLILVKGYGILGLTNDLHRLHNSISVKVRYMLDIKYYEEIFYWYCRMNHVNGLLMLKEEIDDRPDISPTPRIYKSLVIALDRYYPKITEALYDESRSTLSQPNSGLLAHFANVFSMMNNIDKVKLIYTDLQLMSERGANVFKAPLIAKLLVALADDQKCVAELEKIARTRNLIQHPAVQSKLIEVYAKHRRINEIETLIRIITPNDAIVYRSLLKTYAVLQLEDKFEHTLTDMKLRKIPFDDGTFAVAVQGCRRFRGSERIRKVVEGLKASVINRSERLYTSLASLYVQLGDYSAAEQTWHDMVAAKVPLNMVTFNRYLELFVYRNNMIMIQAVLEVMMVHIPPNPITTSTVVDMLGKMGRFGEMEVLLEEMSASENVQPTRVTYHHAMSAYGRAGELEKMEAVRERMRIDAIEENHVTQNIVLDACGRAKQYDRVKALLVQRTLLNIPMDDFAYVILLQTYGKARMRKEVDETVEHILDRHEGAPTLPSSAISKKTVAQNFSSGDCAGGDRLSTRLISAIIDAYANLGDTNLVDHFVTLLLANRSVSRHNIDAVMVVYHRLRETAKMEALLKNHLGGSEFAYNITAVTFAKTGQHKRVEEILKTMKEKRMHLHSNTAVIVSSMLLRAGNSVLAQNVLQWKRAQSSRHIALEAEEIKSSAEEKLYSVTSRIEPAEILERVED